MGEPFALQGSMRWCSQFASAYLSRSDEALSIGFVLAGTRRDRKKKLVSE
jgi:hypothetical protein